MTDPYTDPDSVTEADQDRLTDAAPQSDDATDMGDISTTEDRLPAEADVPEQGPEA